MRRDRRIWFAARRLTRCARKNRATSLPGEAADRCSEKDVGGARGYAEIFDAIGNPFIHMFGLVKSATISVETMSASSEILSFAFRGHSSSAGEPPRSDVSRKDRVNSPQEDTWVPRWNRALRVGCSLSCLNEKFARLEKARKARSRCGAPEIGRSRGYNRRLRRQLSRRFPSL